MNFEIGRSVLVDWKSQKEKAVIVDKKEDPLIFYVHFINYDRRLDEWVGVDRIEPLNDPDENEAVNINSTSSPRKRTRLNSKRRLTESNNEEPDYLEQERENFTKIKNINEIVLGKYVIGTWYYSPYPEEFRNLDRLFICQCCLKYMRYEGTYKKHLKTCPHKQPVGSLIYSKGTNKVYQLDGDQDKLFSQNLCLLSKLFLDHKTVYYDISPFLFYVLTELQDGKEIIVGYFSKEKKSYENNNLACLLVLPPFQKKGYGRLLIEFSYELSKLTNKIGSPEKPLSDLGLLGYRSYWQAVILDILKNANGAPISIREMSLKSSIKQEDIASTLTYMGMIKYSKGEQQISVNLPMIEKYIKDHGVRIHRTVDPICIQWVPPKSTQ